MRITSLELADKGNFTEAITHAKESLRIQLERKTVREDKSTYEQFKVRGLRRIRALEERARAAGQLPANYVPFDVTVQQRQGQRNDN